MRRRLLAAMTIASVVLFSSAAHADDRAELEKARASYLARNWSEATERLEALLDPSTGKKERGLVAQARMYLGAVQIAQGKPEAAKDTFEKLMLEDPTFEPDPLGFPSDVINTFIDVRAQLQERLKTAAQTAAKLEAERKAREAAEREAQRVWLERVKAQAMEEKITVRNSRLVALLPFGAGQFQNGRPVLGWFFLGTQAAALAGTVVTFPMTVYARDRAVEEARVGDPERKADQYNQRAEVLFATNLAFGGAFVVLAAVGIVQANLGFVPEVKETKPRELPPMPSARVTPFVAPTMGAGGQPGGFFAGVQGFAF